MLSLSLLFIIITCVDIICQDAMGKSLTENQIKFKKELEKKSAKDSGKTRLILHAKLGDSVCLGYWPCQRPLGSLSEKKYGIFWEFFPYGEGGSHQIPKLL